MYDETRTHKLVKNVDIVSNVSTRDNEGCSKRKCKICGRTLKKFTKNSEWTNRAYHIKCFNEIVSDIANFNTTAYKKYGYTKRLQDGTPVEEAQEKKLFILKFD